MRAKLIYLTYQACSCSAPKPCVDANNGYKRPLTGENRGHRLIGGRAYAAQKRVLYLNLKILGVRGPFFQEAACDLHLTENSIPDEKKLHNARGKPQIGVSLDGAEEVTFKMI